MRAIIAMAMLALAGCATQAEHPNTRAPITAPCPATAASLDSPPGAQWYRAQGWRYASRADAAAAYARLVADASPWPDWVKPQETMLPPGTRFQMAIGGAQTPEMPGGFGTFDRIDSVADVRGGLAVRQEWKPQVDRVVTYETVRELPVRIGPVGPQVDPGACALLVGRWSQFEMLVPRDARVTYLKVVEVRPIR